MARLFAKVYADPNYLGQYRWIRADVNDFLSELGFNDNVSSIRIYKGNDYQNGDLMRFYEDKNCTGGYLDLGPGSYPNIDKQPFLFGNKISSVDILPYIVPPAGLTVRLIIRLYKDSNYGGEYRDILATENNLATLSFNNTASSLRVLSGEDYVAGWVCDFFDNTEGHGGMLPPGRFEPGTNIPNLAAAPYLFDNKITSVTIHQ